MNLSTCARRGCTRRAFMDSDRCFDHQTAVSPLTLVLAGLWAIIQLVNWVVTK